MRLQRLALRVQRDRILKAGIAAFEAMDDGFKLLERCFETQLRKVRCVHAACLNGRADRVKRGGAVIIPGPPHSQPRTVGGDAPRRAR